MSEKYSLLKMLPGGNLVPSAVVSKMRYFVVNEGDPKAVYQYTADGDQCLGCVIRGLDDPSGIAISKDGQKLFVAESITKEVKIFQRQS